MPAIRIDVGRATGPGTQIEKARIIIHPVDDGLSTFDVLDRRTQRVLASGEGELTELDRTAWTIGDWRLERSTGCGCGGTKITKMSQE